MAFQINKDVNYGPMGSPLSRHGADCYWFNTNPQQQKPCVVFVHGGGWMSGDKNDHRNDALRVAQEHQVNAFTINYKLGTASFPDSAADIRTFIDWLRAAPCCDDNRVMLIGLSAGGHLCCWNAAKHKTYMKAALSISGPLDLTPAGGNPQTLIDMANNARGLTSLADFSPATHMTPANKPGMPHIWDARGRLDALVTDAHSFRDNMADLSDGSRQILTQDDHAILTTSPARYNQIIDEFITEYRN